LGYTIVLHSFESECNNNQCIVSSVAFGVQKLYNLFLAHKDMNSTKILLRLLFGIASFLLAFAPVEASNKCGETLILDGSEPVVSFGVDTTRHWWALTQPFSNQTRLWVDGAKTDVYQELKTPNFSPDGESWATFGLNVNGVWNIVYKDSVIPIIATEPRGVYYGRNGNPAIVYAQGTMEMMRWKGQEIALLQRSGPIVVDCYGNSYMYVSQRSGGKVIVTSQGDTPLYDDVKIIGIWNDGRPLYVAANGLQWRVYLGNEPQSRYYDMISQFAINQECTIAAFVGKQGQTSTAVLLNDEYYEPIESQSYLSIENLTLHPLAPVYAFNAINQQQIPKIVFSSTEYAAGKETSKPMFTYNGEELLFLTFDTDFGISINGKRYVIQRGMDLTNPYCVKPYSKTMCFSSGVAMVMLNLEKNTAFAGLMVDQTSTPRYNRFNGRYESIGRINNRLYLMHCTP
jgi:hypothetical protein